MNQQQLKATLITALKQGPVMPTEFSERYAVSLDRVISALRLSLSKVAIQKGSYFSWNGQRSAPKQYPIFVLKTPRIKVTSRLADEESARYSRMIESSFRFTY